MQGDGNLVMYPLALPTDSVYSAYWATMTVNTGSQVVFDSSDTLYLELENKSRINVTTSDVSTADFYQRVTLDPDGVLRHYVHPKDAMKKGSWRNDWTVIASEPSDICQRVNGDTGSGACGFNSYCQLNEEQEPDLQVPALPTPFWIPAILTVAASPDFVAPSCGGGGDQEFFELREMANTDWPGSDYEHYRSFNEDQCRESCMDDCLCAVAIFRGADCWKKRLPLSKGRIGSYVGGKALIKVGTRNTSSFPSPEQQSEKNENDRKVWLSVGLSSLTISLIILFCSVTALVVLSSSYHRRFRLDSSIAGSTLRCFTYKELEEATNGFRKELGNGAFGIVYQGFLPPEPKICVAVKKLDKLLPEREKEFMAEVRSIGQTHHKNLVRLLGYCNEGADRLLVYEFMSNGSLTAFLFQEPRPGWYKRVEIVLGIVRGLLYLHEECKTPIIHCDIKPQNILLDDEFTARISDFGLAKLLGPDQTRTNTGIRGTKGYVAPEWFRNLPITAKVDVYSFGVMLLEIISCRRNLELELPREEETVLVYWAYDCYKQGRVDALVGNDEEAMTDLDGVLRLLMVAIWCIQEDPSRRPTMKRVWQMLDCTIVVPAPPDPSLIN
ncbi:hypothetical protein J5N97_022756 [Dioscorea zingiberensis]|uniref:non-specific serine/threonine protein kinase n=1 Tax=Dioscorea zingiberensis TaxID=325984 RepID=A0A9D5CBI1_9LILI|nr:hypothetical protein J5N97_022756 [Dioscorea zingiberensis]